MKTLVSYLLLGQTLAPAVFLSQVLLPTTYEAPDCIRGVVTDSSGEPAENAVVGYHWVSRDIPRPQTGLILSPQRNAALRTEPILQPEPMFLTDNQGQFETKDYPLLPPRIIMVMDEARQEGAIVRMPKEYDGSPLKIKLQKTVEAVFEVDASDLGSNPNILSVNVFSPKHQTRIAFFGISFERRRTKVVRIPIRLPEGEYLLLFGTVVSRNIQKKVTLDSASPPTDPITIKLVLSSWAQRVGQQPLALCVTDSVGIEKDLKLERFRGKWLIIEFWAYWCGPCVGYALPELVEFCDRHQSDRSKFDVLTIHCSKDVKTAEQYRQRIKKTIQKVWHGKELPFPVLIDGEMCTAKTWGIESYPKRIIIDPSGKVTSSGSLRILGRLLERGVAPGIKAPPP